MAKFVRLLPLFFVACIALSCEKFEEYPCSLAEDYGSDANSMEWKVLLGPSLVYGYPKKSGRFSICTGLSPQIHFNPVSTTIAPWGYLIVGYAF